MSGPYVSMARGRDPYTLYCINVHCLDISNVPTEFKVPSCVKPQNNTYKNTATALEIRTNVHGQAHEHTACKNAYNDKGKRPSAFCGSLYFLSPTKGRLAWVCAATVLDMRSASTII